MITALNTPEAQGLGFSGVYVKNLDIRTYDNPGIGGVDLNYAVQYPDLRI